MISIDKMTDEDFEIHALNILGRELGSGGLARFIRLNRSTTGDYTRDRQEWLKDKTISEIVGESNVRRNA